MFYNEIASSKTVLPTVHLGPPIFSVLLTPSACASAACRGCASSSAIPPDA